MVHTGTYVTYAYAAYSLFIPFTKMRILYVYVNIIDGLYSEVF